MTQTAARDDTDFVHTGVGTLAGRYLRLFWQPIYRAIDLQPGRAIPIRIMSEDFTLYRGEGGQYHLVAFRCAHRGTQLSVGWVEGDCIRCRYHGWQYDASGQCLEQPGEDPAFAAKVHIRSYPVQEYLGLVFAYLGEAEPPPIRRYPNHERPGVLEVAGPEVLPCNFFNRIENFTDHVAWTHSEAMRRSGSLRGKPAVPRMSAEETEYGAKMINQYPGRAPGYVTRYMPNSDQHDSGSSDSVEDGVPRERLAWNVPIDDEASLRFRVDLVPLSGEKAERYRAKVQRVVRPGVDVFERRNALADAVMAGKMRIEDLPPDLSNYFVFRVEDYSTQVGQGAIADRTPGVEHLGRQDAPALLMRMLWRRELRAFAEGCPLTPWRMPDDKVRAATDMAGNARPAIPAAR